MSWLYSSKFLTRKSSLTYLETGLIGQIEPKCCKKKLPRVTEGLLSHLYLKTGYCPTGKPENRKTANVFSNLTLANSRRVGKNPRIFIFLSCRWGNERMFRHWKFFSTRKTHSTEFFFFEFNQWLFNGFFLWAVHFQRKS